MQTDNEAELKKAKFYALKVLNFRPRSVEELTEKLKTKGYADPVIGAVVEEFAKKGLLDDSKFSRLWVESRLAARPTGASILKKELKARGVDEKTAEKVLEASLKGRDEYETVKQLADDRMVHLKGLDKTTAKRRLFGFLKRRGFSTDIIFRVLEETKYEN